MKRGSPPVSVSLNACLFAAAAATEIQLLPAGEFAARDGRPGNGLQWTLSDADGRALAARLNARANPLVIDYEHQTLNAEANGQPAPAAGWASRFEWRPGVGLFAVGVEWTARAKQMIESGEYRFVSPVFVSRKSDGVVIDLLHAALVNNPALDGMAAVAERIAASLAGPSDEEKHVNPLLTKLLAAIGLAADTTEDSALTALAALKVKADGADAKDVEIAALKAKAAGSDDTATAAMKTLQAQVADMTAKLTARDLDDVVGAALASGKLVPAQEKWARDLGGKDLQALKTYIETAPAVAALGGHQTRGRGEHAGGDAKAIAQAALKYQRDQAAAGVNVTTQQAVAHVNKAA